MGIWKWCNKGNRGRFLGYILGNILAQCCPIFFEPRNTLMVNHEKNRTQRAVRGIFKKNYGTVVCRDTQVVHYCTSYCIYYLKIKNV